MLTRLAPVTTLIDTKQQSATTSFNQGCSAEEAACLRTYELS